ncbi:acetyl-CoA hydrolase/transferase family protein [Alicyclobacillus mengziensis]|uniref:Acetyl-CoA hydrolase/transferase family protein n=1 Tax=Alicyclobacillus mengziensis TaxID=2931921 RepID=A0A9X7W0Y0_9BACL|nr:acetyl-CoA hydrolase/transferase family protein [Alicyclobacillus mengziensis]QSO48299.1 acetyl-CoA hydrolase/transferase family protein [Alicyclobacillus mengziensis]
MEARIRMQKLRERIMTADEAAGFIQDGMTLGISGFTRAGDAKAVPMALAERCKRTGEAMHIQLWTGASVAEEVDRVLAEAGIVSRRLPYQSDRLLRDAINRGDIMYTDQHLSLTVEMIRSGELGRLDVAIIEAVAITENGGIIPSTSVGNSPTFAAMADKVIIELNTRQSPLLEGMHDIYLPGPRPHREPLPLKEVNERIGTSYIPVDPDKIVGIVLTDRADHFVNMVSGDEETEMIARHLLDFFETQVKSGQMPPELYPLQSGVGAVSNAVLSGLKNASFKNLTMYSEVLQDAVFELLDSGVLAFASGCAITVTPEHATEVMQRLHEYRDKIILRPQEISNHPELIRRLGIIAMNTALEADIYGNVNSTHVCGTHIMNGIGGSGDFARNSLLSVFVTKSTAKNGQVSSIVPMVSHVDHTEHDVDILVTEQGLADLRGLAPRERSRLVIEQCAHPDYKDALLDYVERAELRGGQTPHVIEEALSWHQRFRETGSMRITEPEYV